MGNDNNNSNEDQGVNTNALHNLMFFIILVFLCVILYFTFKTYQTANHPVNVGSLQHYDSLYDERQWHISMSEYGDVTGYHTPDGLYYTFEEPIPADIFYNE